MLLVCFSLERCSVSSVFVLAPLDLGSTRQSLVLGLSGAASAAALWGKDSLCSPVFENEPENQLKSSGKQSLVRHKSGGVIDAVVHDQRCGARHVFFNTSPPPPSYLPHLESIKELWEEGENLTSNVFTMPGKTSETTFIRLRFSGPFLFANSSTRVFLALPNKTLLFLSKCAAMSCCNFCTRGHMRKVSYHTQDKLWVGPTLPFPSQSRLWVEQDNTAQRTSCNLLLWWKYTTSLSDTEKWMNRICYKSCQYSSHKNRNSHLKVKTTSLSKWNKRQVFKASDLILLVLYHNISYQFICSLFQSL